MARRLPKLRRHVRGVYFAEWNGRRHWFSADLREAERLFLDPSSEHPGSLRRWSEWASARADARRAAAGSGSIAELAVGFLGEYLEDGRADAYRYQRKHLARFLHTFGAFPCSCMELAALAAFRKDLHALGLAPSTVRKDLTAAKSLLAWGMERGEVPTLNLRAVRMPRVPARRPESLTREEVAGMLERAERKATRHGRALRAYLELNYRALLRPTDTVRLVMAAKGERPEWGGFVQVRDRGEAFARGAFELHVHKSSHRSGRPRLVPLTDQALQWLDSVSVTFRSLDAYSRAARSATGQGPKLLQRSAARHLLEAGEDPARVDLLLGHEPSGAFRFYARADPAALRRSAARLSG